MLEGNDIFAYRLRQRLGTNLPLKDIVKHFRDLYERQFGPLICNPKFLYIYMKHCCDSCVNDASAKALISFVFDAWPLVRGQCNIKELKPEPSLFATKRVLEVMHKLYASFNA